VRRARKSKRKISALKVTGNNNFADTVVNTDQESYLGIQKTSNVPRATGEVSLLAFDHIEPSPFNSLPFTHDAPNLFHSMWLSPNKDNLLEHEV
jgi:hypothetical protein